MEYGKLLKRTWQLVWSYRALWIFGAILALTTVSGFYFGRDWVQDESQNVNPRGIVVKLTEDRTIYLPGDGLTIDLTAPEGIAIWFDDNGRQRELRELGPLMREVVPADVWAVLIALGIVVAGMVLVGRVGRYVAEAALIRMVNQTEETDEKVGLWKGLRLGFSRSAWRIFLIDLTIDLPVILLFLLLLALMLAPLGLWATNSTAVAILGTVLTSGLLLVWVLLLIAVRAVLSLLVQVARRASSVEDLGAWASIRRGVATVRSRFREVGVVWLLWIAIRVLWMAAMIPILIVLTPIFLLSLLGGVLAGAVPALVVGVLLAPFLGGPFPWIVGALAGLPIMILVTISPMLFLSGLVEVGKSGLWTLAYRELLVLERAGATQVAVPGAPSLEAAPTVS
jgi:hypothetical protein